jgi:UV DNA damage repair endonuclease
MALGASRKLKVIKRLGFACKWIDTPAQVNGIGAKDDAKKYNTSSTTVSWLNRQSQQIAEEKLWDLVKGNIESTRLLVERVGALDENLRMVRLSSDILPVYTEPRWKFFYGLSDVRAYCEREFGKVGAVARERGVRLSMHPGQFTVLASESDDIVNR